MSGKRSRTKGKGGERELVNLLNERLQRTAFRRNITQARDGGHDLLTDLPVAIEVKRQEKPRWTAWVKQAQKQALQHPDVALPVVAHRHNHGEWTMAVVMDLDEFVAYLELLE